MIEPLPPKETINGKFSAYCGVCWRPAFALWVSQASPDYSRCPLGEYTAQTCPSATADVRQKAFLLSAMQR